MYHVKAVGISTIYLYHKNIVLRTLLHLWSATLRRRHVFSLNQSFYRCIQGRRNRGGRCPPPPPTFMTLNHYPYGVDWKEMTSKNSRCPSPNSIIVPTPLDVYLISLDGSARLMGPHAARLTPYPTFFEPAVMET